MRKYKSLRVFLMVSLLVSIFSSLTNAREGYDALFDSKFDKASITIKRVAIIPNRLPMTLSEPEKWREFNWEVMAEIFEDEGFEVIDYETTLEAVKEANLPLEDTGASEEKFAQAGQILNADILIMPYYGTGFNSSMAMLTGGRWEYLSLVSLQIYSTKLNKFFYRADATGKAGYRQYGMMSMLVMFISPEIGAIVALGTQIMEIVNSLKKPDHWWRKGFIRALEDALDPFFAVYERPSR